MYSALNIVVTKMIFVTFTFKTKQRCMVKHENMGEVKKTMLIDKAWSLRMNEICYG